MPESTLSPSTSWLKLRCAICGAVLTRPLLRQAYEQGLHWIDREDVLPQGAFVPPSDMARWRALPLVEHPAWGLGHQDFLGNFGEKYYGCCGPDGTLNNLSCPEGHPVGHEVGDCWLPSGIQLLEDEVVPEWISLEWGSMEGVHLIWRHHFFPEHPDRSWELPEGAQDALNASLQKAVVFGAAWDEPFPRYSMDCAPRPLRRYCWREDSGLWTTLHWTEGMGEEATLVPKAMVPWARSGRCVPLTVEHVLPVEEGLVASIQGRLPDGMALRFHDPLWALNPDQWQAQDSRREWHTAPTQAWVRLVGLLERVKPTKGQPAGLRTGSMDAKASLIGRFKGWQESGEWLGQQWLRGSICFPGTFLQELPVLAFPDRGQMEFPEAGGWVEAQAFVQGTFERYGNWKGNLEFHRRGRPCKVSQVEALTDPMLRGELLKSQVDRLGAYWVSRWGVDEGKALQSRVHEVQGRLLAFAAGKGDLAGVFEFLDEGFTPAGPFPDPPGGELAHMLISCGLLNPDEHTKRARG